VHNGIQISGAVLMTRSLDRLLLTSWPNGVLRPVTILEKHPIIKKGYFIRYLDGDKNTTTVTSDFLFEWPKNNDV
tara:strand:- start:26636 stop:26860 length:225 start_codon:yes stop_codon:yes gene_type:complete